MSGWDNGSGGPKKKFEQRENSGSAFENDHKTTDKHPDFTGSINVEGRIYWLSLWKKTSAGGKRYLSASVRRQDERPAERPTPAPQTASRRGAW